MRLCMLSVCTSVWVVCADLEVKVNHVVPVEEGHSFQDLPHEPLGILLTKCLLLLPYTLVEYLPSSSTGGEIGHTYEYRHGCYGCTYHGCVQTVNTSIHTLLWAAEGPFMVSSKDSASEGKSICCSHEDKLWDHVLQQFPQCFPKLTGDKWNRNRTEPPEIVKQLWAI